MAPQVEAAPAPAITATEVVSASATEEPMPVNATAVTVTATPTATAVPEAVLPTTYKVVAGDSLHGISELYGVSLSSIVLANGIWDSSLIYAGQEIIIPNESEVISTSLIKTGIIVVLADQTAFAVTDGRVEMRFVISSGMPDTPTPTGHFVIMDKRDSVNMTGTGYDYPDVTWVMYFKEGGYALHAAYWHNDFGHQASHGCVNLKPEDAQWLYNWASVGTEVIVLP